MNLTLQDMLGIVGPLGTLMLIMWHHFNSSLHNLNSSIHSLRGELRGDLKELNGKIDRVDEKLSGKIDAVRDRVSRIEGLLKIMPAEEIKSKEEVRDQKEVLEDKKVATVGHAQKLQQEGIQQIVSRMLHDNEPIDKIIRWTGISKDSIKKLAF